ncbi:hypothetical protein J2S55_003978 [Streptosporangium brasiliense]|uniref:Uncharacterized protein n=1 Tax=Streptosporangium brasiliense TaxID=47480 RepID=A0ABT9R764_9ACTN|nr:hypothetical protein [Streptosporangium brasiliense]
MSAGFRWREVVLACGEVRDYDAAALPLWGRGPRTT